jgi:hypothetical protein
MTCDLGTYDFMTSNSSKGAERALPKKSEVWVIFLSRTRREKSGLATSLD